MTHSFAQVNGWMFLMMLSAVAMALAATGGQRAWAESAAGATGETMPPVGGANAPDSAPPIALVIDTADLDVGRFQIRVPVGQYEAPPGGAPAYSVPGPIVAFRGPDGRWRGHGYLETYPRLLRFESTLTRVEPVDDASAAWEVQLDYRFEHDRTYRVTLTAGDNVVLLEEQSNLGPRNVYVFDAYYGDDPAEAGHAWLPASGFAVSLTGEHHNALYLPCYYDKPEVTMNPAAQRELGGARPGGVAVYNADPAKRDVAGFWVRQSDRWERGDTMGIQLWQRRQLPSDPASRHFIGPETKSDATPNPRTADLLGPSLYEGHVTIEFNLGTGTRRLGFTVTDGNAAEPQLPDAFKAAVQANR
ncbi:MAG: hypothetical protein WD534_02580 [Phycisphaeraceae bacterium]